MQKQIHCDIIIPVWNELQLTKDCIDSLIKHTHYPYRLVIVDNASEDRTKQYLEGLAIRTDIDVKLIRNEHNLGFAKAINQGFRASNADYVCVFNNDTLVTKGWLNEMVDIAESSPQIGILNPSSNSLGQYLHKGDTVDSYAERLKDLKGQWQEMGQCAGFCMLIKREVIEKVGLFDEIFGIGFCEETDFCRRAQKAGFKFARAKASYVYHIDSASFQKRPDREEIFRNSHEIFFRRWGKPLRIAYLMGNYYNTRQDKINNICLQAAREHHQIWVFCKKSLREFHRIPDHFNTRLFWLNDFFYRILCIYKILRRKRKKKIDIIFSEDRILSAILEKLKFYHEADIVFEPLLEKARQLWKQRAIYP